MRPGRPSRGWAAVRTSSSIPKAPPAHLDPGRARSQATSNRLHLDIHASGERGLPIDVHKQRVDAEARRLQGLGATLLCDLTEELEPGVDLDAVALQDPGGNEFDIT
jgi:hypothetical protein